MKYFINSDNNLPYIKVYGSDIDNFAKRKNKFKYFAVMVSAILVLMISAIFAVKIEQTNLIKEINYLKTQQIILTDKKKLLKLEIDVLKSPKRLKQIATSKLNLYPPNGG